MEKFFNDLADILDVDVAEISLDMDFRSVDGWGSLLGFSIIVLAEEEYNCKIEVDEFIEMKTIGDIYTKIFDK